MTDCPLPYLIFCCHSQCFFLTNWLSWNWAKTNIEIVVDVNLEEYMQICSKSRPASMTWRLNMCANTFTKTCGHTIPKFKKLYSMGIWWHLQFSGEIHLQMVHVPVSSRLSPQAWSSCHQDFGTQEHIGTRSFVKTCTKKEKSYWQGLMRSGNGTVTTESYSHGVSEWVSLLFFERSFFQCSTPKNLSPAEQIEEVQNWHFTKLDGILPCKKSHASSQIGNQSMSPDVWFPFRKVFHLTKALGPSKTEWSSLTAWMTITDWGPAVDVYMQRFPRKSHCLKKRDLGPEKLDSIHSVTGWLLKKRHPRICSSCDNQSFHTLKRFQNRISRF